LETATVCWKQQPFVGNSNRFNLEIFTTMATISFYNAAQVEQLHTLKNTPVIIGRHPECDIQIDDASVSRHHARITLDGGHFYLQDLNSRNGTLLNGSPIAKPTRIFDNAKIKICDTTLTFALSTRSGSSDTLRRPQKSSYPGIPTTNDNSSIFMDDFSPKNPSVMLDVPSHHLKTHQHASAEQKLIAITKIAHALSESLSRDEVLVKILDFLLDLYIEADRGFIILKNENGDLEPVGLKTRHAADDEQIRVSRTIVDQVIETKRPVLSSDAASDDRFDMSQSIVDFRIRSIMCAPLINSKEEVIGVIQLDTVKQAIAFNEKDLETLVTVALQASLAVQKSDMFEAAKRADHLKVDLQVANEIQQKFLPQRAIKRERYDFFSYYRPMEQVGGDYFDYVQLDENRAGIIVADVVGHGIAAALLMAKVSAESRFALARSQTAVEAIHKMNASLSDLNIDRFVTLVLALVDFEKNEMSLVNAGHMPPIIRNAAGEFKQVCVHEAGIPLGIMDDFDYESVQVKLQPGDVVTMYTDGVNEAMNNEGEQLTTQRLIDEVSLSQCKTPQTICEQIVKIVSHHSGNTPAIDDACVVCFRRED
jgi:serine phosphatase RsbU (regulator of sigma subunit)/pSer/pThr/pTyr-binding forkhead associated (FHA) protein